MRYFIIGLFIFIAIIVIFYFNNEAVNITDEIKKVCFQNNCFNVEIANNNDERFEGLMFRESLCEDCSMLFVFEKEGNYKFWMKNTLISLDIIWMNEDLEVIYISHAVPCAEDKCELYGPDENSLYVLEINERESENIELKVGDKMKFES